MSLSVIIDGIRYVPAPGEMLHVSIHGMYDCHLFHEPPGSTVDEVIAAWQEHNRTPALRKARTPDGRIIDLGRSVLCPAIVMCGDRELRRVGDMVYENERGLAEYRAALLADPDVSRLLAAQAREPKP
jgi:hypothetical protein